MSTEVELFEYKDIPTRPGIRGIVNASGNAEVQCGGYSVPVLTQLYTLTGPTGFAVGSTMVAVPTSRDLTASDFETILSCASGITITLPNDATLGITDTAYAPSIAIYAAGAVVPTLDVSAVTMRGTAPTVAQYGLYGIVRVGANEWAYV